jgi:hypothetical protein
LVANVFLELISVNAFVLVAGILLDIIVGDPRLTARMPHTAKSTLLF